MFPEFNEDLRQAFRTETSLFFQNILREDRSVLELLDADYTFLNQRLAEHYGIPGVYGPQFRRVDADRSQSRRAAGAGKRADGDVLPQPHFGGAARQVDSGDAARHAASAASAGRAGVEAPREERQRHHARGHGGAPRQSRSAPPATARMDPLGFALENYDGVGKWRDKDVGNVIDASGKLPDGTAFVGPAGLKKILITRRRDEFVGTATQKLLIYALGRGLEYYDLPAVRSISRQAAKDDYRMSALISAIVSSAPFQMRRTPEE